MNIHFSNINYFLSLLTICTWAVFLLQLPRCCFHGQPKLSLQFFSVQFSFARCYFWGSKVGAVVRALASHQCEPGSNPGINMDNDFVVGFLRSLFLRGFSPRILTGIPSPQKSTLPNFNSIWNARTLLNECFKTPQCFMVNKCSMFLFYT